MERGDVARLLNVAEADVADFEVGENVVVELRDGARRVITSDGVFALTSHPSNRQLRRWLGPLTEPDERPGDPEPERESYIRFDLAAVPDGTAAEVLAWVNKQPESAPDRALRALEVENGKERPRSSLVAQLEKVASA